MQTLQYRAENVELNHDHITDNPRDLLDICTTSRQLQMENIRYRNVHSHDGEIKHEIKNKEKKPK